MIEVRKLKAQIKCDCGKLSTVVLEDKSYRDICDCDYPCGCFNGTVYKMVVKCPKCGAEETVINHQIGR